MRKLQIPHLWLQSTSGVGVYCGETELFATWYQVNIKCLPVRNGASYSPLFQSRLVTLMRYIVHLLKEFFHSQSVCGFGSNTDCTSFVWEIASYWGYAFHGFGLISYCTAVSFFLIDKLSFSEQAVLVSAWCRSVKQRQKKKDFMKKIWLMNYGIMKWVQT